MKVLGIIIIVGLCAYIIFGITSLIVKAVKRKKAKAGGIKNKKEE